ncbi:MAG: Hsp70 family protein [Planctomycetia bacterium]|nr:Hsp70 family protein [Planctomycetia bacterium]
MSARYAIGIDLGTTNSALAYAPLDDERATVEVLPIPQLTAPGVLESRPLLPSFTYLAGDHDRGQASYDLPWAIGRDYVVGEWARKQSADAPTRTVAAAKSWLAYSRVDRRKAILPWGAPDEVAKISPVEASRRYLEHLVAAWTAAYPSAPFADQSVVLTVPASFDAAARELTREAALAAGFPEAFILLEEPQAAVYAWLADTGDRWRRTLQVGESLLVCDVGGGTTDFTLVEVAEERGELMLRRAAVGNHTLVGGDNMDLALAHYAAGVLEQKGAKLDPWQSVALWHSCRAAKEALLASGGPEKHPVAVLGRGSRLVGGTISADLVRDDVVRLLVDGFFPPCEAAAKPQKNRASGFRELGLPYEVDTAVTRHLALFLSSNGVLGVAASETAAAKPLHVLFNGGVFKADTLRARLLDVLAGWCGAARLPRTLEGNSDLDCAVARGAAYYARSKTAGGIRIRGGTARSYYVGIESAGLAIPGAQRPLRALCVVPFGMEEGTAAEVPGGEIGLVVGEPAEFRFFSSAVRKSDRPGDLRERWADDELVETDPLATVLPAMEEADDGYVPVRFESRITELGVFELWCASTISPHRWKLEFSVREESA